MLSIPTTALLGESILSREKSRMSEYFRHVDTGQLLHVKVTLTLTGHLRLTHQTAPGYFLEMDPKISEKFAVR
jgi:hypothetical protein